MKPKLLVVQLWGLGDLLIGTPFLQAACQRFAVTLLAKPFAKDLQARFWKEVRVVPFVAPWTAFTHKYRLVTWPWREIFRLRHLLTEKFDVGLSARWDPRDHILITLTRARRRLGFPRLGSQVLLTEPLRRPDPCAHHYENWRAAARALDLELPPREKLLVPQPRPEGDILVHTGAGQPVRVWALEQYRTIISRLRQRNLRVKIVCDPDQRNWWTASGEKDVAIPRSVGEMLALIERAAIFLGNDSGPGHLAAFCGVPTFTIFGPQLPEWFVPLHPAAEWIEGKPCPYRPCSDYCRFPTPRCLDQITEEEVWTRIEGFVERHIHAVPA
jgi:ADP-heptose:LPS heptosyltransferase